MTLDAFHPDHLKPGNMVGPWRIVESLGTGNFGHTFKVELEGELFILKMAMRPAANLSEETLEIEEALEKWQEELSREQELEELSAAIQELGAKARTAEILEAKVRAAEEQVARQRKLGRRLALAAGPLLLGLALVSVWREWRSSTSLPEVKQGAQELEQQARASNLGEAAATEFLSAPEPLPMHEGVTADVPPGPQPGQRAPPCKRPQIEINGGCWILVGNEAPPCVDSTYEWKKRCYFPVPATPRPSTSELKDKAK